MNMDDRYDNRLFSILEEVKTLPNFLNVFFGFLYRRTDYFQISTDPNIRVGLPNGVAQKLLLQTFKKYENVSNKSVEEQVKRKYENVSNNKVEVVTSVKKSENVSNNKEEEVTSVKNVSNNKEMTSVSNEVEQVISVKKSVSNEVEEVSSVKNVSNFDAYNGAVFKNYAWSQTISDIDIQIKIPDEIRSKQLQIDITSTHLLIKLRSPSSVVYLKGELCKKCKMNETVWSLGGQILQIHLEKLVESWWDCLLTDEPRLDFNKMDCSRPYHELSEEARVKIEQLTWDQEQRNRGCLTSEEVNLQRTLQKAWNVEGSPFSGEYDPTKVNLG